MNMNMNIEEKKAVLKYLQKKIADSKLSSDVNLWLFQEYNRLSVELYDETHDKKISSYI